MSSCDCHIEATDASHRKILRTLLILNGGMFLTEVVVGFLADSTGVLADSLDMLADALVYALGLYAIGRHSAVKRRAAFFSGVFQIVLALGIAAEIVRRAVTGSNPESLPMFLVSIVALAVNIWCLRLISKEKEGEVHMRASYIFSKNDVIANAGVILSSILIHFTGSRWPDLVIGAFITAVVLRGGVQILTAASRESRD